MQRKVHNAEKDLHRLQHYWLNKLKKRAPVRLSLIFPHGQPGPFNLLKLFFVATSIRFFQGPKAWQRLGPRSLFHKCSLSLSQESPGVSHQESRVLGTLLSSPLPPPVLICLLSCIKASALCRLGNCFFVEQGFEESSSWAANSYLSVNSI